MSLVIKGVSITQDMLNQVKACKGAGTARALADSLRLHVDIVRELQRRIRDEGLRVIPKDVAIKPASNHEPTETELLVALAKAHKALLPGEICRLLNASRKSTKALLKTLRDTGILGYRAPGVYYLSISGLERVKQLAPQTEIHSSVAIRIEKFHEESVPTMPKQLVKPMEPEKEVQSQELSKADLGNQELLNEILSNLPRLTSDDEDIERQLKALEQKLPTGAFPCPGMERKLQLLKSLKLLIGGPVGRELSEIEDYILVTQGGRVLEEAL